MPTQTAISPVTFAAMIRDLESSLERARAKLSGIIEGRFSAREECSAWQDVEDLETSCILLLNHPDEDNAWRWVRQMWHRHYREMVDRFDRLYDNDERDALWYIDNIMVPFIETTRKLAPADRPVVVQPRLAEVIALDGLRNKQHTPKEDER